MGMNLWDILSKIKESCEFVELSHTVSPDTPHWSGFPAMSDDPYFNYADHGFYANEYRMVSQYGTHVDAPCHFIQGGRSLDAIDAKELILPLCVIDIREKASADADYAVSVQDIKDWECAYGPIPPGAFVALCSDWSKRSDMDNYDAEGSKHYPGWTLDAVRFLVEQRNVTAIGHETSDTDPPATSSKKGYAAETYLLKSQRYQIELLRNLDIVPPKGAVILCAFPAVKNGSGFTARCIAVCGREKEAPGP